MMYPVDKLFSAGGFALEPSTRPLHSPKESLDTMDRTGPSLIFGLVLQVELEHLGRHAMNMIVYYITIMELFGLFAIVIYSNYNYDRIVWVVASWLWLSFVVV